MMMSNAAILTACIGMSCLYVMILLRLHFLMLSDTTITENGDLEYLNVMNINAMNNDIDVGVQVENMLPSSVETTTGVTSLETTATATATTITLESTISDRDRQSLGKAEKRNAITQNVVIIPDELPKALQFDPSLIDALKIRNNKRVRGKQCCGEGKAGTSVCRGVCFTPQACEGTGDNVYPFRDEEEKNQFRLRDRDKKNREKCLQPKPPHQPPNRWNTSSPFPFAEDLPPTGCSRFTGSGGSGSFQNLIIIPGAKLAFCGIPKVGITNWLQFIRFVMGAHDYPSVPHTKSDLRMWSFDNLVPEDQERIWNDPEWTFAAIMRNPAERLLSAYLDKLKVENKSGGIAKRNNFTEAFTFDLFLERLEMEVPDDLDCRDTKLRPVLTGINWCTDPHWRPQVWGCGMSEKIDRFDFIGSLDHIEKHSRELLERVGLWESHGKYYRNGISEHANRWNPCASLFPLQDEFENTTASERRVGFQIRKKDYKEKEGTNAKSSWDSIGHARGAGKKKDEYYTPELYQKVEEKLYRADYQVWKFLDNEEGDWVSGKDILPHLLKAKQEGNVK